ncbi:MAG: GNAT family N-acetyltransferase, partial [Planctomycetes bacterium]|nr:GNAT family N-acetyltransferase [Planctomycetota bacterium]
MPARRPARTEVLTVVPPDPRRHGEALFDLIGKVFSGDGYYAARDRCRRGYILRSHYDWQASRVGLLGDRLVTHFGVWDLTMRIGAARVRLGGIGGVATDGDCRKRGYMARTARASVEAMRDAGYDLSLLFGISDFYHRFGYVRGWSDGHWAVSLGHLPTERPARPVRTFTPRPRDDLARLYNRENATRTGTAVRPTFTHLMWPHPWQGRLWLDARGRPAGYVTFDVREGRLNCCEACGDPEQALRVLARLARQRGCSEVRFEGMHAESPIIRRIRWGTCRTETYHVHRGGAMIALLNLAATLEKMRPVLADRLRRSPLAAWRGRLVVADARGPATLAIDRACVRVGGGVGSTARSESVRVRHHGVRVRKEDGRQGAGVAGDAHACGLEDLGRVVGADEQLGDAVAAADGVPRPAALLHPHAGAVDGQR